VTQASTAQSPSGGDPAGGAGPGPAGGDPAATGVPAIVRRRLAPLESRLDRWSWPATLAVVALAALLRLWNLGYPKGKIFDETYYATDAHNLLVHGFEWDEKNNTAAFVVHPPLGKWMIAAGEWLFGYNEFGWRVSAAVCGTLSVLMLIRIGRRLFGSTLLGCTAGLLLAVDGFHLVLSRTALLDIFLLFFVLAAFGALVLDRDARRRRWLRAVEGGMDPTRSDGAGRPPLNWAAVPWWRLAAAVLLGCAMSVKWSALYFVPVFVLLVIIWEAGLRRSLRVRRPWRDTFLDEGPWLVLAGLLVLVTYVATWSGWLLTDGGYYRHFRADNGQRELPVIGALGNLWDYHLAAYNFHTGLDATHKYQSWPWQWLVLGRPVAFYWTGEGSCGAASCASEILLLGTPLLWWSFIPALAAMTWLGIARRDWRPLGIGLMVAAALLPWFWYAYQGRTMFAFYAAPALPFLILAVVYVLGAIATGPPRRSMSTGLLATVPDPNRRLIGAVIAGGYVVLVVLCFAFFYPIFVGQTIPYEEWSARMWFGSRWI